MDNATLIKKDICQNSYGVWGTAIFDTVPSEYSSAWLKSAPNADKLILCSINQYPKTVKAFFAAHPNGTVYAAPYTAYTLKSILGSDVSIELLRDKDTLTLPSGKIQFTSVSQSGKGAYLIADCKDAGIYSGAEPEFFQTPIKYAEPTVVIAYVSGCDYTETIAEKLSEGIIGSEGLSARLIDLASTDARDAVNAMIGASGVLIGTPCVNGEAHRQVWELLTYMSPKHFAGKFASAFGAYTWNSSAVPHVIERMRQLKMALPDGGFTLQYKPDEAALKSAYEYGYYFGCKLQNKPNTHLSKLVKCLVCGEIFDSSLGVCPVCGVGMDKCVPVEDEVIGHSEDTDLRYLILGGGIAALSAAEAIRRRDKTGDILMLSSENTPPINRPMLSKNMAIAARVKDSLAVKAPDWFEENSITLRLSAFVRSIDPNAKQVTLSDGSKLSYDKLIYALGAECFIPPIKGTDKNGVFSIRYLRDVYSIWERLPKAKNAVVIGGGVLGLEAAAELKKMRLSVTVLETAPALMSRQLDADTSAQLIKSADEYGIRIFTGANIVSIDGDISVAGVTLSDGTVFPADIVVVSCGARANIEPALTAGIGCGRAVKVSPYMQTDIPDIYACGDCAELEGMNFQLWAEASEQGRIAGANAAGDKVKYTAVPYGASFDGMNTSLYAIGDVGKEGKDYKLLETRDEIARSFAKYFFADGRLCGGILYGDTSAMQHLTDALNAKLDYVSFKRSL